MPPLSALMAPALSSGKLYGTVAPDAPVKLNSGTDPLAAAAFVDPEKYNRSELNIASDELSGPAMATTLSEVTGKEVFYEQVSRAQAVALGMLAGTAEVIEWISETGYGFEIAQTREYGFPLKTFRDWAGENTHRIFIGITPAFDKEASFRYAAGKVLYFITPVEESCIHHMQKDYMLAYFYSGELTVHDDKDERSFAAGS